MDETKTWIFAVTVTLVIPAALVALALFTVNRLYRWFIGPFLAAARTAWRAKDPVHPFVPDRDGTYGRLADRGWRELLRADPSVGRDGWTWRWAVWFTIAATAAGCAVFLLVGAGRILAVVAASV